MRRRLAHPDRFDDNDAALLALVADRAALAIGNASLYEREHRIVETLQRSLLPARLPRLPGMSIAARYLPGGGADVGGDWYDAIALDGGGVGVAMGDVVGHGIEAASLMGQLRNALRAYAIEGTSPAEVLTKLDRLMAQTGARAAWRRCCYAVVDPDLDERRASPAPGTCRRSCSGRTAAPTTSWAARAPPLGRGRPDELRGGDGELEPGSTLVLYTDGLVEVRGRDAHAGLDRLKEAVAQRAGGPEALCAHVIEALLGNRAAGDDVAFLALQDRRARQRAVPGRAAHGPDVAALRAPHPARAGSSRPGPAPPTASTSSSPPTRRARTRSSTRTSSATRWSSWRAGSSTRRWRSRFATRGAWREQAERPPRQGHRR